MTPQDLDALPPSALAQLLGLHITRGRTRGGGCYVTPCPACGAVKAWDRPTEKRGAVVIEGGWRCYQCPAKGSRGDLCARVKTGRAWASLSGPEIRAMLGSLGGPSAPYTGSWAPEPPRYLDGAVWAAIVAASGPAWRDRECRRWAEGRGLRLARTCLALPRDPVDGLPLRDRAGAWLPARGYRLGLPMCDHTGKIVSMRLRSVTGAPLKEVALPGYNSAGAVYASWRVREAWLSSAPCPRPCVLVEGGPDWLAAGAAWHEERDAIGYVSGSMSGEPWARWLAALHPDTILIPQQDELSAEQRARGVKIAAGQKYAAQIREAAPWVREVAMGRVYAAAGQGWRMGLDLAHLPREGVRLPPLSVLGPGI